MNKSPLWKLILQRIFFHSIGNFENKGNIHEYIGIAQFCNSLAIHVMLKNMRQMFKNLPVSLLSRIVIVLREIILNLFPKMT